MKILGIDPGTRICGYGAIESSGNQLRTLDFGTIRCTDGDVPHRLKAIYEGLTEIIRRMEPGAVAVEKAFYGKNPNTAIKLGQARAVALLAAAEADAEIAQYPPATVKKSVVGNGRAQKDQVQLMVSRLLGLAESPSPQDASDALALAICHSHRRNSPV
ncbi:MAG: crossover junction endodeoxyribonuclease RuvC [Planctomycetota bacterium]